MFSQPSFQQTCYSPKYGGNQAAPFVVQPADRGMVVFENPWRLALVFALAGYPHSGFGSLWGQPDARREFQTNFGPPYKRKLNAKKCT